jgi:hypothetical protein
LKQCASVHVRNCTRGFCAVLRRFRYSEWLLV